ncbi:hypothetical protein BCR44DRAFT_1098124 [Catenaria anguillulae PL171]|uniref:[histone H3]-dimethyl-L-lysine(36) demethylase n=1 Tax=Catenaria anguillulae PL171 TaxID=765915 RepID=A0A1Y2I1B7_9FUNG|nr:hypothetical protein BCR44DRAFT_1098124 [Catenaria anguillulae PL171]
MKQRDPNRIDSTTASSAMDSSRDPAIPDTDPAADPNCMDVDSAVSHSMSATATASAAPTDSSAANTSMSSETNHSLDSAAPSRPPRRSAALAAQAALAASADADSSAGTSATTITTTPGSGPASSSGSTPDKWVTYLADCRAQSLFSSHPLRHFRPHNLTTDLLAYDFLEPFFMTDPPSDIGMSIPDGFSPDLIAAHAGGSDRMLEIIDVADQSEVRMSLADWVDYFKTPKERREKVLNLLSLEISQQPLGKMIGRPWVVRQMDLVSRFWPSKRQRAGDMPKFQLYCLMGTEGSFTDFHIDFGVRCVLIRVTLIPC